MEHRVISQENSDRSANSFYWLSMIIVLCGQKNLNRLLRYDRVRGIQHVFWTPALTVL